MKDLKTNPFPSYAHIEKLCRDLAHKVQHYNVTRIVGVSRGGLIPAVHISHLLELPLSTIHYSSKRGAGDDKNHDNILPDFHEQEEILIVDDIADSGYTLKELKEYYSFKCATLTAALYYKTTSVYKPDFYADLLYENSPWLTFPWER